MPHAKKRAKCGKPYVSAALSATIFLDDLWLSPHCDAHAQSAGSWLGGEVPQTHGPILAALNARQSSRSRQKETIQKYWKKEDPKCSEAYHPGSWAITFLRRKAFLHMVDWRTDHRRIKPWSRNKLTLQCHLQDQEQRGEGSCNQVAFALSTRGRRWKSMFWIPQKEEFQCPLCPWSEILSSQIALSNPKSRYIDSILHSARSLHLS